MEPIHDDIFGQLTWDPLLDCWLGGLDWPPGVHTEVALWLPNGDLAAGIGQARASLTWLQAHEETARRQVAGALLECYNDVWRDEEEPITEDELMRRTELVRIGFLDDGSLLLSYDGRDLFGGHVIDGFFNADRSFRDVNLVG